jgi:hypothetical protein
MATLRLSEKIHSLQELYGDKDVTLLQIVAHFDSSAQALLTLFFSIPFLFFIPLPGLSVVLGAFIMINGMRIALNRKPWLPEFLLKRKMPRYTFKKILSYAFTWVVKIERLVRPRGQFIQSHPFFQRVSGAVMVVSGFLLMLPLPPGTNFLPGLTTFLMSLGILEKDGRCIVVGYFCFCLTLTMYITLPIIGIEQLKESVS